MAAGYAEVRQQADGEPRLRRGPDSSSRIVTDPLSPSASSVALPLNTSVIMTSKFSEVDVELSIRPLA
jgi:hypothetical protein